MRGWRYTGFCAQLLAYLKITCGARKSLRNGRLSHVAAVLKLHGIFPLEIGLGLGITGFTGLSLAINTYPAEDQQCMEFSLSIATTSTSMRWYILGFDYGGRESERLIVHGLLTFSLNWRLIACVICI